MSTEQGWSTADVEGGEELSETSSNPWRDKRIGFNPKTGIHNSLLDFQLSAFDHNNHLDTATFVLSQFPHPDHAESRVALIDSLTNNQLTYAQLRRSIKSLAASLYHALGIRKGDVVFLLSPNSILYPTICLAVLSIGAVLTTANPLNTESEIAKQVHDSGSKLGISSPHEVHKLTPTGLPTLTTTRSSSDDHQTALLLSVEELIQGGEPLDAPQIKSSPSDTAALLYTSGTTGVSKGVILTHSNFMSILSLLKWTVETTSSKDDIYLCFIPMFHIYGLAFFGLGLFCVQTTIVLMPKFDFHEMLKAIETHQINNIPAVPPVILGLVKYNGSNGNRGYNLSSLRRVCSGAAPLSKEVSEEFRKKFPWVELRQGYGLTETCGATSYFVSDDDAKGHPGSAGKLLPGFSAKVVDVETGVVLPPYREGELCLRSPTVMKGYLGNEVATAETIDSEGWLHTGDLVYFDEDGFLYVVDRIKELIKHNGYQVAPTELEAILLSHPHILDAAVIQVEDEEAGQIPMAYVVRAADSGLAEDQVIQFIGGQVAPYKKVRKVGFIDSIPRSAAGKILRKELIVMQTKQTLFSKL